ncbi:MAG: phytanoyl-CoA dioxygenase family protein [Myxococcota bacterium]|nr:phytanoyl-CoA dioxygenase family protein [Myxococcota bacterium]
MDTQTQLERCGYAVHRGLLTPSEIQTLREGFDALAQQARGLSETAELDGARFVVQQDPFRLHRVVWCGAAQPEIAALGSDPRFLAQATQALGSDALVQIIQQAHFKFPGDGVDFRWHQDASNRRYGSELWTDVNGRGSFLQMVVAVDPMTAENGPIRVLPGTHKLGFVADPKTGALPEGLVDESQAVDLLLEPGDAAFFGPFLIHGSAPNRGTQPRRLFLQGYTLAGANRRVYPGCGTGVRRRA